MQPLHIHDNVAEMETDEGIYHIAYESWEGSVTHARVVDFTPTISGHVTLPSDEIVLQEAMSLIEDHLSRQEYEFSRCVDIDDDDDHAILEEFGSDQSRHSNLVVVAQSAKRRAVKFADEVLDNERLLFSTAEGRRDRLNGIRKPLASIVTAYCHSVRRIDDEELRLLLSDVMSEVKAICWDMNSEGSPKRPYIELERRNARLWVHTTILKAVDSMTSGVVKYRIQEGDKSVWYNLRTQTRQVFDTTRFKLEHPELYEKYLVIHKNEILTRKSSANSFPLADDQFAGHAREALGLVHI